MGYRQEFPHFQGKLLIPDGFEDISWHNEELPRAGKEICIDDKVLTVSIWQNAGFKKDIGFEYAIGIDIDGKDIAVYTTDDPEEIKTLAKPWQYAA